MSVQNFTSCAPTSSIHYIVLGYQEQTLQLPQVMRSILKIPREMRQQEALSRCDGNSWHHA